MTPNGTPEQVTGPPRQTGQDWQTWPTYEAAVLGFRNYWYPVQWSSQVGDRPTAVTVMGERMDWARIAEVMSVNPARIAGLDGHGRTIAAGEPANLALVDPSASYVVDRDASLSLSRNNPWHGRTVTGQVVGTWLRGTRTFG